MRHAAWAIALTMLLLASCARLSSVTTNPAEGGAALPRVGASATRDSSGVHIPRSPAMRQHVPW